MNLKPLPSQLSTEYDPDSLIYEDDESFYFNHAVPKTLIEDIKNREIFILTGYYEPTIPPWKKYKEAIKECNKPTLYLLARGKRSGKIKFKVENFLPYCYVDNKYGDYKTYLGTPVEKVYFECSPIAVGMFREECEKKKQNQPHEADVLYIDRFLIDCGEYFKPKEVPKLNVGIFDIETNFPVDESIISFSINDGSNIYHNNIYKTPHDKLIKDLKKRLESFDVVTGWNVGFDVSHTENEIKKLTGDKLYRLHHDVAVIDLLTVTKYMWPKQIKGSWSLDNTGYRIAGEKKVQIDKHPRELTPDELEKYNNRDVVLPKIIDDITGGLECFFTIGWMSHTRLENTDMVTKIDDIELLNVYHKAGVVLNSKPPYKDKPTGKAAAYKAADPQARPGVYNDVMAFDLKHAYPWASMAINATAETVDEDGEFLAPNGMRFNNNKSVFVDALENIMNERAKAKKQMKKYKKEGNDKSFKKYKHIDFALKTQAAAFSHGEFGYWRSRMQNYGVAEAITQTAKDLIFHTMGVLEWYGYPWVYEHTDSCYIRCPKNKKNDLVKLINSTVSEYCKNKGYRIPAELEFEEYYPIVYIHSPARNVLVPEGVEITDRENWKVTGMNFMRSETPEELADIEEELVMMSLQKKSISEKMDHLMSRISDLDKVPQSRLGIIKPLNKDLSKYGGEGEGGRKIPIPYHIKAYLRANKEYGFELNVGEKFMILPIITNKWSGKRVIKRSKIEMAFPVDGELPEHYKIDYENYLKANLVGKIYGLFDMTSKELFEKIRFMIPNIEETNEIVWKAKKEVERQEKVEKYKRQLAKEAKKKEKEALKRLKNECK